MQAVQCFESSLHITLYPWAGVPECKQKKLQSLSDITSDSHSWHPEQNFVESQNGLG